MSFTPPAADRPGHDPRLLAQTRDAVLPALADVFATALARFDDVLFDRAERAGLSQMIYLDGMRELRRRRDEIVAAFRSQLEAAWAAFEAGNPLNVEAALSGAAGQGLSLVSEDELESRLAVRNLAATWLREWKPLLTRLEQRLGRIAGVTLDAETDPVGPEHVGVALYRGFAACELSLEVRLVLFKLCERDLFSGIGKLYESLDARLAQSGVLPELAARRPAAEPARPRAAFDEPVHGDAPEDGGIPYEDGDDAAPAWANRFLNRWADTRSEMRQWAEAAGSGFAAIGPGPSRGPAASAAGGMGGAGLPDGAQGVLLDALHELLQQTRRERESRQAQADRLAAANAGGRSLSQREMLSVLSLLQATPTANLRAAMGEQSESLAQRLKSEVLSGATQLGVDPAQARLDPVDEDAIDLVGMLFDVLLDERDLTMPSKELIGKLVVPFVKVALLDRKMFVQKTHPARRLLNALAEACEGNQGESSAERNLMGKVEEVVERLVAEFNENIAIFMMLEEEFRDFLAQHRRRVEITERRAAEIQRGQERLDLARERAKRELEDRIDGREDLPGAVLEFLRTPWQHHATMAVLREGVDGSAFVEALALADGLLDEVDEARGHPEGERAWLAAWDAPLRKVLQSMGVRDAAADTAISALRETLAAIARSRPEQAVPLPALPPVAMPQPVAEERPRVQLVGGTDTLDFDNADADHFRALPVGTWLDFVERDGKVQAGKLSWVSPISKRLLFVNRRGVRFCVASPEELAVMVRLGRLRAHANDTAFDSAMQSVIDRLAPDQARAPDAEEEAMPR